MFVNKSIRFFLTVTVLGSCVLFSSVDAKESSLHSQLLDHAGKSYTGAQDPSYLNYDLALREYMVDRISKRFGIALDPKIYSGFDLLEIEALFKCKKPEEPFDLFLKMVPKHPSN
jgi:ABC-type oligopeptide transport system substrate-binding subunit